MSEPAADSVLCEAPPPGPGSAADLWQRYRAHGPGHESEDELIRQYLPLVRSVVGRMAMNLPAHVDAADLNSAGLIGLLSAVRQYNPQANNSFEAYARLRIRGAVLDELRRMDWAPRSVHVKARRIQATMEELEKRLGRLPEEPEVAAALKVSVPEYRQWLDEVRPATFICLDAAGAGESDDSLREHELVSDPGQPDPADRVSRTELARLIAARLEQLPELHRKVILLYYFEDLRLREIAAATGFSASRICQIHAQAVLAIRAYVAQHEAGQAKSPLAA
jgi:RNA polymerase sigma factor for flagellar operon FliA